MMSDSTNVNIVGGLEGFASEKSLTDLKQAIDQLTKQLGSSSASSAQSAAASAARAAQQASQNASKIVASQQKSAEALAAKVENTGVTYKSSMATAVDKMPINTTLKNLINSKLNGAEEKANKELAAVLKSLDDKEADDIATVQSSNLSPADEQARIASIKQATAEQKKHTISLKENESSSKKLSTALNMLSAAVGFVVGTVTKLVEVSNKAYKSGMVVTGYDQSINFFVDSVTKAGMKAEDMANAFSNSFIAINMNGAKQFVSSLAANKEMAAEYGLAVADLADFSGSYLETLRMTSSQEDFERFKQSAFSKESLATATLFSRALGKSVSDMQKASASQMKAVDLNTASLFIQDKKSKDLFTGLAQLAPGFAHLVSRSVADPKSAQLDETFKYLQNIVGVDLLGLGESFRNGTATQEEIDTALAKLSDEKIQQEMFAYEQSGRISAGSVQMMIEARDAMQRLRQSTDTENQKMGEAVANLTNAWNSLLGVPTTVLKALGVFDVLASGLNGLASVISTVAEFLTNLVTFRVFSDDSDEESKNQDENKDTTKQKDTKQKEPEKTGLDKTAAIGGTVGVGALTVVAGYAAMKAIPKVLGMVTNSLKSLLGIAGGSSGAKGGLGLKAIGIGLKSFASAVMIAGPKLAIGATLAGAGIAAFIALVGGGIYIAATGIERMAESLMLFKNIDGNNLSSVGSGMIDLSKGMLAMAGSSLLDSIASFEFPSFGDDNKDKKLPIIETLEQFRGLSDTVYIMSTIGSSIQMMSEGLTSLSASKVSNLQTLQTALASNATGTESAAAVSTAIKEMGEGFTSIPTDKINNLQTAFASTATSIQTISASIKEMSKGLTSIPTDKIDNLQTALSVAKENKPQKRQGATANTVESRTAQPNPAINSKDEAIADLIAVAKMQYEALQRIAESSKETVKKLDSKVGKLG